MSKLTEKEIGFLCLLLRSEDVGDGWRLVSGVVWPLVEGFTRQGLIELNPNLRQVRLSEAGRVVVGYI